MRSRRVRRWATGVAIAVALYALIGFVAVPALARKPAERAITAALARPASIGHLAFNPFTLCLTVRDIHIGEHSGTGAFVDIGGIRLRLSWSSLFRLKPIVGEFLLQSPRVHIVRSAPQQFNFSDLLAPKSEAAPAPAKPQATPQFAVYNIRIVDGSLVFDDQVLKQQHRIEHLDVGVPFVANLPSKLEVFVQPQLRASIDGSAFDLGGQVKPFASSREAEIAVQLEHLQLPPLLAYSPAKLPVSLGSGWLSTDLHLHFKMQPAQPLVEITGSVDFGDLDLKDGAGQPLLRAQALHLAADSIQPLHGVFHLGELRIVQPVVEVQRDAAGAINLLQLRPPPAPAAAAKPAAPAAPAAAAPLDVALRHFVLSGGAVHYQDFQLGHPAALALDPIEVELNDVSTLAATPAHYKVQIGLKSGGTLATEGSFQLKAATLDGTASVQDLELPPLLPFAGGALAARLDSGTLNLQSTVALDWSKAPAAVKIAPAHLELQKLRLSSGDARQPVIGLERAAVDVATIDLAARQAQLSAVELDGLEVNALRSTDGAINLQSLVHTAAPAHPPAQAPRSTPAAPAPAPWHYRLASFALLRSALSYTDAAHAAAAVHLKPLELKLADISDDTSKPWQLKAATTINGRGSLSAAGTVSPAPLKLKLRLNAKRIDLAAFQSYAADQLNANIVSALFGASGELSVAQRREGMAIAYRGDAGLSRVRMLDKLTSDTFATVGTLSLGQIDAAFGGGAATRMKVGAVGLDDFYARIFLDSRGQLNLSRLVKHENAPVQSLTRAGGPGAISPVLPKGIPEPVPPPPEPPPGPPALIQIGAINLSKGQVNYTDNFIKPNFSANLDQIVGSVGTIGTQVTEPAPLQLRAQLESNGPLAIDGHINPLAKPSYLDLTASAHSIVLTNFSTYAEKYVGYRIDKGTLSVDLHYKLANGLLSADNHIFIDQFTFGDRVDSPSATSLPVRLAVSLLKDAHGQIDLDLPVSGSLSDPQFSVTGIVWYALKNLIEKAVTAPFSLIARAFGGSEELGYVSFAPGSAKLAADQDAKLQTLQKALADRPAVKLDVAGRVDPAVDVAGLQQLEVEHEIKQQKLEDLGEKGVATTDLDSVVVAPNEYNKYLKLAYSAAKFDKPSNLIGLDKALPPDQMRALLLQHAPAGNAELLALAQRRAAAVDAWFSGKLPPGRIYVTAPQLDAGGIKDSGPTTRADFKLH